ncbi:MAG: DUF938 domain-containing protein [Woeseiaceae bacterium]|nr:DUF938 domain-containing protein [Woeseiaceae bacterium]
MNEPVYASASVRNSAPILGVLRHEFKNSCNVLEIGSGTGFHAATFAQAMPHLFWQTSDLAENLASLRRAVLDADLPNIGLPLELDVTNVEMKAVQFDTVYSCNTAHIMHSGAVRKMISLVGELLAGGGVFCLYGPFRREGRCSTPSNTAFDQSLRARNAGMGIRDLEAIDDLTTKAGMTRSRIYAMPANNLLITWRSGDI